MTDEAYHTKWEALRRVNKIIRDKDNFLNLLKAKKLKPLTLTEEQIIVKQFPHRKRR